MSVTLLPFITSEHAAEALSLAVSRDLMRILAMKSRAVLAVSGGRTPRLFFEKLSLKAIDWRNVIITLVDERWVPEDHARSNAGLVRRFLLQNRAGEAEFIPLFDMERSPEQVVSRPSPKLFSLLCNGIDVAVLGMGNDGHTASFFPGAENLDIALSKREPSCLVSTSVPLTGESRITFSASSLLCASNLYMQVEGSDKIRAFQDIINFKHSHPPPACVFFYDKVKDITVFMVDKG